MAWMCTLLLLCLALLHPSQETDSICQSQHGKVCKQNDTGPTKCKDERTKKQPDKCRHQGRGHNEAEELERECKLPLFEGMFSNGGVCKIKPTYKPAKHEEKMIVKKIGLDQEVSLLSSYLTVLLVILGVCCRCLKRHDKEAPAQQHVEKPTVQTMKGKSMEGAETFQDQGSHERNNTSPSPGSASLSPWTNWTLVMEGVRAVSDDQKDTFYCARFAVGKGIQDWLHFQGYDGDQEKIVQALINLIPEKKHSTMNTTGFHNKRVTVTVCDQVSKEVKEVDVIMRVETATKPTQDIPFASPQQYKQFLQDKDSCLVLRWCTTSPDSCHAIYARAYKPESREFVCLDSNPGPNSEPVLSDKEEVERVYRVRLTADVLANPGQVSAD